jgi:AP-1 complex subunit gamma-1
MSRPDVNPGATETQQMRITAPTGVSIASFPPPARRFSLWLTDSIFFFLGGRIQANIRLRIRISYSIGGRPVQDQVDFSGFPPGLTG